MLLLTTLFVTFLVLFKGKFDDAFEFGRVNIEIDDIPSLSFDVSLQRF